MDKVGVTQLLRRNGLPLAEAYDATDGILQGRTISLALAAGTDVAALLQALEKLGVLASRGKTDD